MESKLEDQRDESLLGVRTLMDLLQVMMLTATVLVMAAALAGIVWAGVSIFKCCRRRQRVQLEIQLEDNFQLVERRVQAQRAARKAEARDRAVERTGEA